MPERRPDTPGMALAFDFGLRHIGVAVGQNVTGTATALTVVRAREGKPDWSAIDRLLREWQPTILLVGLPLNMDGSESNMSRLARRFAAQLQQRARRPAHLVDERLTSHAVRDIDPDESHAEAAAVIARQWLSQGADHS